MVFPFTCPVCGVSTDVSEEYVGQTGPCAACGSTVTVTPPAGMPGYSTGRRGSTTAIAAAIVLLGILGVIVMCGFWGLRSSPMAGGPIPKRPTAMSSQSFEPCRNNLELIGAAMLQYHDDHGTFPPAYVADDDGERMHSWRVLLLPYLGQDQLHKRYDFDKPWDSPKNIALAKSIADVYRCLNNDSYSSPEEDDHLTTSYLMVTGPGTVSHEGSKTTSDDVTDGPGNTILVVESISSGIKWTEPRDLDVQEMSFQINAGSGSCIEGHGYNAAYVLFCDGSVQRIGAQTEPKDVKSLTTIAGGETEITIHYSD